MKISAFITLFFTIAIFLLLCLNVMHFILSLCLYLLNIETGIFHPVIGALIPIIFLIDMMSLLYTSDYQKNLNYFDKLTKNDKIKIAIYASLGLINPMLLYLHTKSYNHPIRIFGILRCFPVVNVFMYLRLIKRLKRKGYENIFVNQYFKGTLVLTLIREEKL